MKRIFTLLVMALIGSGNLFAQNVQFIDNIADPSVDSVNIYFVWTATAGGGGGSGEVGATINDATFRSASAFLPITGEGWIYTVYMVPSGPGVTVADSTTLGTRLGTVGPINTSNYAVMASGLSAINVNTFLPNPSGLSTAFGLSVDSNASIHSSNPTKTAVAFFNGVTDAPTLLMNFNGDTSTLSSFPPTNLFAGAAYGAFSSTGSPDLSGGNYFFSLVDSLGNSYGYYYTQLKNAADSAGIIFTSGFLDSSANGNGANFGLYIATSGGEVVPAFTAVYPAFVQVIYDVPDTSINEVELSVSDAPTGNILYTQIIAYGTSVPGVNPGSPYVPVVAGDSVVIALGPVGDHNLGDAYGVFGVSPLYPGSFTVFVADGLLSSDSSDYPSNPSGVSRGLTLFEHSGAPEDTVASSDGFLFFQGVIDAADLNLNVTSPSHTPIVHDLTYGTFDADGYISLDTTPLYILQVTDSGVNGISIVQNYLVALGFTGVANVGLVAFTTGFINPSTTPFNLFAVAPSGTAFGLPTTTGINSVAVLNNIQLYPNPSTTSVKLSFNLENTASVQYRLINTLGQQVQFTDMGNLNAGTNTLDVNVAGLNDGLYVLDLMLNNNTHVTRTIEVTR